MTEPQCFVCRERIALNFGVWSETNLLGVLNKSRKGYIRTYARAHPFSISREWLGGLCLNLLCRWRHISYAFYPNQWWSISARAHVRTSGVFKKMSGGQPREGAPFYLEGVGQKSATAAQCAAGRLREKSESVLTDRTFDGLRELRITY